MWYHQNSFDLKGLVNPLPTLITPVVAKIPVPSSAAPDSLSEIKEYFLQMADAIQEVFWISHADFFRFLYVSPAYETIWGVSCETLYRHPESIVDSVVPEDRMRWILAMSEQALHPQNTELEYRIRRPDSTVRWIRTRLFPIRNGPKDALRVAGISEDITDRKLVEREILEISGRERQRMGQEIHDGICQHLTGIAYMLKTLEQNLTECSSKEADSAAHMGQLLHQAIDQGRRLARGLYPINLDANGLMSALREMASNVEKLYGVGCCFECQTPILMDDHDAATHLYRITQEAVSNAITHGRATQLAISLTDAAGVAYLRIRDNGGAGLTQDPAMALGMGLRIMQYRARMIGAKLTIQEEPGGGVLITCALPLKRRSG